jgi:hypothetical protein
VWVVGRRIDDRYRVGQDRKHSSAEEGNPVTDRAKNTRERWRKGAERPHSKTR